MKVTSIVLFMCLAIGLKTYSQNGLIKLTAELKQEFIESHNKWRFDVGSPPLKWDNKLEAFAADWAKTNGKKGCKMVHRKHFYN